ncbi:MAG: biliverdin-producing heme oxygenase [Bdellovibrionota bacterium]
MVPSTSHDQVMGDGAPDLRNEMKAGTKLGHDALDTFFQGKFLHSQMTIADYADLLKVLYGMLEPLERVAHNKAKELGLPVDLEGRKRTHLILEDLEVLGVAPPLTNDLMVTLPAMDTEAQVMGVLYVLEGSVMGGKTIIRESRAALGDEIDGATAFFEGRTLKEVDLISYEEQLRLNAERFNEFRTSLRGFTKNPLKIKRAINSAKATFKLLKLHATAWIGEHRPELLQDEAAGA